MNIEFYTTTLWIAVIWPLLLSIPAVHKRLPWPRYLAIIPAVLLTVSPIDASINIPWLLYGTGFAIDGNVRWILGAFVVIWLTTVSITLPSNEKSPFSSTLYLLTLTGSLGALLTTDLVGFFSSTTLMGYSFYGLLNQNADKTQQRAARLYLYFLITADLALFEALLLVAFTTQYFQFEVARQAMSEISSSSVYLYMVLLGFMLKAGIWPFYIWLTATFNSGTRVIALLLIASPITISLLGLLRWLPLRDDIYITGLVMQLLGASAILHSVLKIFTRLIFKQALFKHGMVYFTTAWLLIAFTGLFSLVLGTALLNPALWQQYVYLVYPFIAITSITLTILILVTGKNHRKPESTDDVFVLINKLFHKLKKWHQTTQQLASQLQLTVKSLWNNSGSFVSRQYQQVLNDKNNKSFLTSWKLNITLFLILGLALTWLAI
ncbi:MAG: proton-conducting transporter membrane subunit [Gammaproteobacteria bacterium]|nr:proton-conducting transporter membrane subunit [Gammaproteobacteria bacterium]